MSFVRLRSAGLAVAALLLQSSSVSAQFVPAEIWLFEPDVFGTSSSEGVPVASGMPDATSLHVMPASRLVSGLGTVVDVAFRTDATAGSQTATWTAPEVQVFMGHVPTPLPDPFVYPTFDALGGATDLGDFTDGVLIWNSWTRGTLTWSLDVDTWNPMGLGSGVPWNGADDMALLITYRGATMAGSGGFPRFSSNPTAGPYQRISTGFQSPISSVGGRGVSLGVLTAAMIALPQVVISQTAPDRVVVENVGGPDGAPFYTALSPEPQGAGVGTGWICGFTGGVHLDLDAVWIQLLSDKLPFVGMTDMNGRSLWDSGPGGLPPSLHGGTMTAISVFLDPMSLAAVQWSEIAVLNLQ